MDEKTQQEIVPCVVESILSQQSVIDSVQGVDDVSNENKTVTKLDKHLQIIEEQLEKAKNPSTYETYEFAESAADKKLKLFTARRKGTKHVLEKTPCQDYCLATSVNGCTILADADGVSSCEHSDVGSKLACEAVVKTVAMASKSCRSEDTLIKRLMSVSFREKLVSIWIKLVMEEVGKKNIQSPTEQLKEFSKYGSTIMFAVITDNWIVAGNLGDGQILVFNDSYGVKLRVHAPKDSSRVRCLVNERCAREDFQIEKYPRNLFNGVLLSTDGMYDSLDKGAHFYDYAIQMRHRFFDRTSPEPYQAFCYKEVGEPYKDFSTMRTQDDCSVAVAFDDSHPEIDYDKIEQCILCHAQVAFLRRQNANCMLFYVKHDSGYADVVVSSLCEVVEKELLKTAEVEDALDVWCDDKYSYALYKNQQAWTLEFMQCTGMLRIDKTRPYESGQMIMNLFVQLSELNKELSEKGLCLNLSALFNISFDGKKLYVKREALSKDTTQASRAYTEIIDRYFSHVLGILECSENKQPLFDIGYIDRGRKYYMSGNLSDMELGQLIRDNRTTRIKNTSIYNWQLNGGERIQPGESVELISNLSFSVLDDKDNRIQEYSYTSKENL